ncbi:carbonic anhydrase 7-like [Musca autumnalis]|uniref:carbonic anhydrase 7-like n=1 Tax=Musca autumnalis TaxID=221902 RepID=UPI003CF10510
MNKLHLNNWIFLFVCLGIQIILDDHVVNADVGNRICAGKYSIPFYNQAVKELFMTPIMCVNCTEIADSILLKNNGDQLVIHLKYDDEVKIPILRGGPLEGKGFFRFEFMYFNFRPSMPEEWGLNNVSFPAELHLVFRSLNYPTYEKALEKHNGIAVASMGFRVRTQATSPFITLIINDIEDVRGIDTNATLPASKKITLSSFMPQSYKYYYTYLGTMISTRSPTPTACLSNVIWIDFDEWHKIHPDDIKEFEKLRTFTKYSHTTHNLNYKEPKSEIKKPWVPTTTTSTSKNIPSGNTNNNGSQAIPNGQKSLETCVMQQGLMLIILALIVQV